MCSVLLKVDAIQRGQTLLSSVQWTAALSSESAFPPPAMLTGGGEGGQTDGTIGLLLSLCVRTVACSQMHSFSPTISVQYHPIRLRSLTLHQKTSYLFGLSCEKVGLTVFCWQGFRLVCELHQTDFCLHPFGRVQIVVF